MLVQKLGISQLILLTSAVASLSNTMSSVLEDGKVDWSDTSSVLDLFSGLKEIAAVDFNLVVPELKDIDQAEMQKLADVFSTKFNIKNDSLEATIEQGLKMILKAHEAILFFKNLKV
jgi:hypothetical protein